MPARPRLSYANVVSTLALTLVVSGGGVAVAGGALKKNSVGSAQIRNGQVKNPDLAKNAVRGAKIANGTVLGADIKDDSLTGTDVRDESLTGADVYDESLTGADIDESTLDLDVDASTLDTAIFAASSGSANIYFTGGPDVVATLPFTAPSDGWVMITGQTSLNAETGGSYVHVKLLQDNQPYAETDWDAGDVDTYYDEHQTFTALLPVTAGAHTFKLSLEEYLPAGGLRGACYDAQLLLQFSPRGSSSEFAPRPAARSAVGNRR